MRPHQPIWNLKEATRRTWQLLCSPDFNRWISSKKKEKEKMQVNEITLEVGAEAGTQK